MEEPSPFAGKLVRWSVILAAALAVVALGTLLLEPGAMVAPPGQDGPFSPVHLLRTFTDGAALGPPGGALRLMAYGIIAVAVVTASMLAGVTAFRATKNPPAAVLSWAFSLSALGLALEYGLAPVLESAGHLGLPRTATSALAMGLISASIGLLMLFSSIFPRRLTDQDLEEMAEALSRTGERPRAFGIPLPKRRSRDGKVSVRLIRFGEQWWFAPGLGAAVAALSLMDLMLGGWALWYVFFLALVTIYPSLRLRSRFAGEADEERLRWVLLAFSLAVWAFVLLTLVPFALGPILGGVGYGLYLTMSMGLAPFVVYLIVVLAFFVAVFYHGAVDPALALRRSTVLGAGAVLFVALFGALENVVSEWIEARVGLSGSAGTMVTGAILAVAVLPFRPVLGHLAKGAQEVVFGPPGSQED